MQKNEQTPGKTPFWSSVRAHYQERKTVFLTYVVLRFFVLAALVLSAVRHDWGNVFICLLVLAVFLLPAFLERNLGIELPSLLEIIILAHVFAAEILGEIQGYYIQFQHWDTLLHITWGFLCAAIGFSLVDILNRSERVKFELSAGYLALTAFCFSMTVGVLWEFYEFGSDVLLHTDMQKDTILHIISSVALDPTGANTPVILDGIHSMAVNGADLGLGGYLDIGLFDTMEDLFVNFIGAVVFSTIGFFDVKSHGKSKLAGRMVPKMRHKSSLGDEGQGETIEQME